MRVASVVVLFLLAAGTAAQEPKKFESKDGRFAVAFPDKPTTRTNKAPSGVEMTLTALERGGSAYMVIFADLPADAVKKSKANDLLDNGEKGLVNNFKGRVTKSQNVEFGKQKFPGREIFADVTSDKNELQLRLMIVIVDARLYQVVMLGPRGTVLGKDGDRFFESFEITP